jgi:NAD-specific glutamate dehydrogenase
MRLNFPVVFSEADVQYTVGIDIKGNFNLRDTTRGRRDFRQLKFAEQAVVLGASTLSFVNLYKRTGLVVRVSGEISDVLVWTVVLRLKREVMTPPAVSILSEGKRGDVEKKILSLLRGEVLPERMAVWTAAP